MFVAQLPGDEGDEGGDADDHPGHGQRIGPAALGALVDAEDEAADGQGRQQRAEDVEAPPVVLP